MKVRTPHIAMATIGCLALSGIAMAQESEIVVEAPYHRPAAAARPSPGAREALPEISVDYKVRYSDLDLSKHSGAVELQKRIKDAATQACQQLATLYPNSTEPGVGRESCVEAATKKAMAEASAAIAAAEKSQK